MRRPSGMAVACGSESASPEGAAGNAVLSLWNEYKRKKIWTQHEIAVIDCPKVIFRCMEYHLDENHQPRKVPWAQPQGVLSGPSVGSALHGLYMATKIRR